jgi:geranylgeranyl diphosphate synthase type II
MNTDILHIINKKINEEISACNPINLYKPIIYGIKTGGKRIRPLLTLFACSIFDESTDNAVNAAIALELFHNFTLFHDDVMDNADLRRGNPTVFKKWNANTAILSGDALLIIAYKYICKTNGKHLKKVLDCFNQTALEVCEGQQFDMDFETQNSISIDDYIEMIRLKTAVLIAAALKIGAIIGNANEKEQENLYNFGINIGIAFQLKDDYLDVFADDCFGKAIGGDIVENKKTFLLVKALERADNAQKKQLLDCFSDKFIAPQDKIYKVTEIYKKLNIKELVDVEMKWYYEKAMLEIKTINNTDLLITFVNELYNRKS